MSNLWEFLTLCSRTVRQHGQDRPGVGIGSRRSGRRVVDSVGAGVARRRTVPRVADALPQQLPVRLLIFFHLGLLPHLTAAGETASSLLPPRMTL